MDVLFIAVAATLCKCDEWEEIEEWAIAKEEWLRQYLELPNGIPSWYTILFNYKFYFSSTNASNNSSGYVNNFAGL